MPFRACRVLVPVLVFSILLLAALLLVMNNSFPATSVAGYPGQEGATATTGPYPGPGTPGPTLLPGANFNSPTPLVGTPYYLPIADRAVPVQFSAAGAEQEHVDDVVGDVVGIPPYTWAIAPDPARGTQMINRCNGGVNQHWCWIVPYPIYDVSSGQMITSNIASISTPRSHPPQSSSDSGSCEPGNATDDNSDTVWVAGGEEAPSESLIINDLHGVHLERIVIDWFEAPASCGGPGVYAKSYQIKVDWGEGWETIYATSSGDGGSDVLTTTDFTNYNDELVTAIRINMTAKPATPSGNYAITEFKVYGQIEDSFFNRAYTENEYNHDLAGWAAEHQGTLWLISNEPDSYHAPTGDSMKPETYGEFYGRVARTIKEADPGAIIAFCQGTEAETPATPTTTDQFPYSWGWHYCKEALDEVAGELSGSSLTVEDVIDLVSVHQYMHYDILNQATRESEVGTWIGHLESFEDAINLEDDVADELIGKPLILTEYGDYNNRCLPATPTATDGPTPTPGGPTHTPFPTPEPGCGDKEYGTAWFGTGKETGYWALTYYTTDYFMTPCLYGTGCNSQWVGAWWFFAGHGGDNRHDAAIGSIIENRGPSTREYNDTGTRLHEAIATTICQKAYSCTPTPSPTP